MASFVAGKEHVTGYIPACLFVGAAALARGNLPSCSAPRMTTLVGHRVAVVDQACSQRGVI